MEGENPELEDFLQKVNEIDGLVKNLVAAKESDENTNAIENADKFLDEFNRDQQKKQEIAEKKRKFVPRDNTGVNRTVINQDAFQDDVRSGPELQSNMSQEAFMSIMESDAKKRAARKAKKLKEANVIKELGNKEFKDGNYEKAIEHYSEALSIIKDVTALWTNRAQSYIKLGEYEKAIYDCDWALRVSEKCIKAYIHKGKALTQLQRYDEALDCFRTAIEIEPAKEKVITGYITETKLAQKSLEEEKLAREAFDAGDIESKGIVGVIEKLNTAEQLPYYYSGGLRVLKHLMKDSKEKALFRSSGGFKLTETHPFISKCFASTPRSLSQDEVDLCTATLEVFETACTENEGNQKALLEIPNLPDHLFRFLESKWKATHSVKQAILKMFHVVSEGEHLRSQLINKLDMTRLLSSLFELMKSPNSTTASASTSLLNNLVLDKTFKMQLRDKVEDFLPAFEEIMMEKSAASSVLPSCVSTVTNSCADTAIRRKLLSRKQTWMACCEALEHYSADPEGNVSVLNAILGLLLNLTLDPSDNLKTFAPRLCPTSWKVIVRNSPKLEERSYGVLAHVLPHSADSVKLLCDDKFVVKILEQIMVAESNKLKQLVKCLTACTQHSTTAREDVFKSTEALQTLQQLLKHSDENIIGNAALCLSHCAENREISARLTDSNVVMDALVLARDAKNLTVRHNCAILIAKLSQTHPRHLERLRELDGLGILHGVMKHIKE